jgi:hypothetical protein
VVIGKSVLTLEATILPQGTHNYSIIFCDRMKSVCLYIEVSAGIGRDLLLFAKNRRLERVQVVF